MAFYDYFDWDDGKRLINLKVHKIDFIDAVEIFEDPNLQERMDTRFDYDEERNQAIGMSSRGILFVVYTERTRENDNDLCWIISARRATSREEQSYRNGTFAWGDEFL